MATLKEEAKAFEPKTTKNIADLDKVSLELQIEERVGKDQEDKEFHYKVAVVDGIDYRVPNSVLNDIKTIISARPDLKNVKVIKKGTGMNTNYQVIPLD